MIIVMYDLLTTNEVARFLCRSAENVRYLTKTGKLPCRRTATGQRIYSLDDVQAFIAAGKNGSRPTQPVERDA